MSSGMVEYYIEAIDQQGRPQTLTLSAKNSTMADELVRSQGLQPTLIAHAKSHAREIKAQADVRRRRRLFSLGGVGLIAALLGAGLGANQYIRYLQGKRGFTLDAIRGAAQKAGAVGSATGSDPELAAFARDMFGAMHLKFPGLLRSLKVKDEALMFVYLDPEADSHSTEAIRLVTRVMAESLRARFDTEQCTVLVIENGVTIADARCSPDKTTVNMHVER